MANQNKTSSFSFLGESYSDNNISIDALPGGVSAPTVRNAFLGLGYRTLCFSLNNYVLFDRLENNHDYDETSAKVYWHLHFTPYDPAANGTYKAKFEIKFSYTNAAGVWQAEQTVNIEASWTETGNDPARVTWTKINVGDATGSTITGADIASIFAGTIKRIAASSNEFPGEVAIHKAGFHYKQDANGSVNITSKT